MKHGLSVAILAALVLGVVSGALLHALLPPGSREAIAADLSIITELFLRLIKMIIAPLVLSTLIAGIAHLDDAASIGRIGMRALVWFVAASIVSLSLGWLLVTLLEPGVAAGMSAAPTPGSAVAPAPSVGDFITHLVPTSIFSALADNQILQIVMFSVLAGGCLIPMGRAARPLVTALDVLAALMLRITGIIMLISPAAVFAAIASAVATQGLGVVLLYGRFLGGFYLGVALLWMLLLAAGYAFAGKRILALPGALREPLMLAFSTASSEAALAPTLAALERFGVRPRIAGFVLPLGYSFNLDGSMMYCSFAALFLAQAYGVELSFAQQVAMLLLLMLTSKGAAGVPRAAVVVLTATLPHFGIPEAGIALLLGIDHFLDMGRTATNVIGNSVAAVVVDSRETDHIGADPKQESSG